MVPGGAYWFSLAGSIAPQRMQHKYVTGSRSDRVVVDYRAPLKSRAIVYVVTTRWLRLPVPYLCYAATRFNSLLVVAK
jgi:hypothetical protein